MLGPRRLGGVVLLLAAGAATMPGCRAGAGGNRAEQRRDCGGLRVECKTWLRDDTSAPPEVWPHAYVSVSSLNSNLSLKRQADSLGVIMFECLPPGVYKVRLDQLRDPPSDLAFACDTFVVSKRDTTRAKITLYRVEGMTPEGFKSTWGTWKQKP
jgi:hypothetical protein